MSQHLITSVIEGDLSSVTYYLEGQKIDLNYNGVDTYRSTNTVNVSGFLNVDMVVRGVSPAAWKLTLSEGANKLHEKPGTVGPGDIETYSAEVTIPGGGGPSVKAPSAKKGSAKKSSKKGGK